MKITPTQVHYFRLQRSGLINPFPTLTHTAHALIGVQAQLKPAANLAFWNRTKSCTLDSLESATLDQRTLVRMWGQRNTLHLYHSQDWPLLHAAFEPRITAMLKKIQKAGGPGRAAYQKTLKRAATQFARGKPLTYKDIKSHELVKFIQSSMTTAELAQAINTERGTEWLTAYHVCMQLVRQGLICHGPDQGNESTFVHRESWLPDLPWSPPDFEAATAELACRYLSAYGPAQVSDLAFWYDTSAANAKRWIEAAGKRCTTVEVDGQTHWCCKADLKALATKPPPPSKWPVRLLYRFDPLLLATKDKSWLIDPDHKKKVWRPGAHVSPVLLVRGRIAGTWRYDRKAKGLTITLTPLAKLTATTTRAAKTQATAIAKFLQLPLADFQIKPE